MRNTSVDVEALGRALVAAAHLRGDFVLASGRRSPYYFDKYRFETQPQLLGPVATLIAERIPQGTDRLAGPELGAVALVAAASLASGLPFLIVRSAPKGYGTEKRIEGPFDPGNRVVLIEDVMTSGGSALAASQALVEAGCEIAKIIAVIDREEGAAEAISTRGYPLEAIFRRSDLDRWLS